MLEFRRFRVVHSGASGWLVNDTDTGRQEHFGDESAAREYAQRQEELTISLQSHWLKTR